MRPEDFDALEEILINVALAGMALTKMPKFMEDTAAIKNIGNAISDACLQGIISLKNSKITKKPGRPKTGG